MEADQMRPLQRERRSKAALALQYLPSGSFFFREYKAFELIDFLQGGGESVFWKRLAGRWDEFSLSVRTAFRATVRGSIERRLVNSWHQRPERHLDLTARANYLRDAVQ